MSVMNSSPVDSSASTILLTTHNQYCKLCEGGRRGGGVGRTCFVDGIQQIQRANRTV